MWTGLVCKAERKRVLVRHHKDSRQPNQSRMRCLESVRLREGVRTGKTDHHERDIGRFHRLVSPVETRVLRTQIFIHSTALRKTFVGNLHCVEMNSQSNLSGNWLKTQGSRRWVPEGYRYLVQRREKLGNQNRSEVVTCEMRCVAACGFALSQKFCRSVAILSAL